MAKYKIEDLREEALLQNWELISTEYKNLDTDLEYKCPKGHTIYSSYKKIRNKYICPICKEFDGSTEIEIAERPICKSKETYRILAFDQSTRINGYAIFDNDKLIKYGKNEIKGQETPLRFSKVREWIRYMIEIWKPDLVIIEDIQLQDEEKDGTKGIITFKVLAELIGVLETFFVENNINYQFAHVSTWRNAEQVKGRTRTDKKRSAQLRVKKCYDIDVIDDIADAILIGRYAVGLQKEQQIIHW